MKKILPGIKGKIQTCHRLSKEGLPTNGDIMPVSGNNCTPEEAFIINSSPAPDFVLQTGTTPVWPDETTPKNYYHNPRKS